MEVVNIPIKDLKPAEYNPRKMTEKQAKDLKESIMEFGLVDPIIVNSNPERKNVIIGGHQRYNICKEMKFEELPVFYIDLPLEAEKELNIRLNKNVGEWDWDMLANFSEDCLLKMGFEKDDLKIFDGYEEDETYTKKIIPPVYEPNGIKPEINELYNDDKAEKLRKMVNLLNINENEKEFLLKACNRFTAFNYAKIADYYANCNNKEVKEAMESLALVIIDFDSAIEKGFVKLSKDLFNLREEDNYEK